MTASARYIGTGAILMVLGLVIGIGWYFAHHRVTHGITVDQVREALVVDSTHSKGYYDWAEGNALNNPNRYVFYLMNITNPDAVLNGAKPNYTQVGPYYYQYIWYNKNATFYEGGNIVEYNLIEDYIFLPNMSKSDPTQDMITTINPAFVTILATSNGDLDMLVAANLPSVSSFVDFITGEYVDILSSQYAPEVLEDTVQAVVVSLTELLSVNQSTARQFFLAHWGNETDSPPYFLNWPGMFPVVDASSAISAATAAQLFSKQPFALYDTNITSIMYWFLASNNVSGPEAQKIASTFSLTTPQLLAVLLWRNASFIPTYVHPALVSLASQVYPTATLPDVGWVQYTTLTFTPETVTDVFGEWYPQFPIPLEIGFYFNISTAQAKLLLVGPLGVLNLNNFGILSGLPASGDFSPWGITYEQGQDFQTSYLFELMQNYSLPIVSEMLENEQTGLFLTRSADYWLWRCVDPLVAYLVGPENAYCGLQTNNTVQPPSQIFTGKNDLSQLGQYVSWRNQSQVNFWNNLVNVSGWTDSGQFSPFLTENQTLYIWDESFVKTLQFDVIGKTKVQDIDVNIYMMNESAFAVSQVYFNTIAGFANETSTNQGAPIFLSNFDFYGVTSPKYNYNLTGNNSDVTTIYVEPNTGSALLADEKLQVNLYYPSAASNWYNIFQQYANVPTDIMFPMMKANQQSSVSESQAKKLRQQLVVFTENFNTGILWGLVAFGAFLVIIGVILIVVGYRKREQRGYSSINTI